MTHEEYFLSLLTPEQRRTWEAEHYFDQDGLHICYSTGAWDITKINEGIAVHYCTHIHDSVIPYSPLRGSGYWMTLAGMKLLLDAHGADGIRKLRLQRSNRVRTPSTLGSDAYTDYYKGVRAL